MSTKSTHSGSLTRAKAPVTGSGICRLRAKRRRILEELPGGVAAKNSVTKVDLAPYLSSLA
eukprot:6480292-Amphidinium_carterae.1